MAGGAGALGLVELGVQDVLCGVDLGVGVLREVHRTLVRLQRLLSLHGPKIAYHHHTNLGHTTTIF